MHAYTRRFTNLIVTFVMIVVPTTASAMTPEEWAATDSKIRESVMAICDTNPKDGRCLAIELAPYTLTQNSSTGQWLLVTHEEVAPPVGHTDTPDAPPLEVAVVSSTPPGPPDEDGDGRTDTQDNCPTERNDQADGDSDAVGDACDHCPGEPGLIRDHGCPVQAAAASAPASEAPAEEGPQYYGNGYGSWFFSAKVDVIPDVHDPELIKKAKEAVEYCGGPILVIGMCSETPEAVSHNPRLCLGREEVGAQVILNQGGDASRGPHLNGPGSNDGRGIWYLCLMPKQKEVVIPPPPPGLSEDDVKRIVSKALEGLPKPEAPPAPEPDFSYLSRLSATTMTPYPVVCAWCRAGDSARARSCALSSATASDPMRGWVSRTSRCSTSASTRLSVSVPWCSVRPTGKGISRQRAIITWGSARSSKSSSAIAWYGASSPPWVGAPTTWATTRTESSCSRRPSPGSGGTRRQTRRLPSLRMTTNS
jgi:hypothetical protein